MPKDELFIFRKSLDQICTVPDRIISVYSLEKHVWADGNSAAARKARQPELQTIQEFQFGPVRPLLMDLLRNMAAPWQPERKENPVGQGYWIQAEFGSGKSHLLCAVAGLALGKQAAWDIVQAKEKKDGRGRRDSLYRFWEEGLQAKNSGGKKGIFVVVKTLVGAGGGTVGVSDKGRRLVEYILEATKDQLQAELGKNISLYPSELLADRFLKEDLDRYRRDLKKFLRDPAYFEEDEFEDADDFVRDIQQNKSPEYKRSCGNKLWRFYTEYLKVQPAIAAEAEEVLTHLVQTILAEGYAGVLLVLDEVSLFMKDRDESQRTDDEKTLVVLSNRLAKVHNLPIWTVCAAQQAIESKMGVKNIIADDRLKLVKLLEEDRDYYEIVLARVREIKDPEAVGSYFLHYKKGFSWPNSIGESEFRHFFPFHKPALEVLRAITYELTTARSAIHFMHQTLKYQVKAKGTDLIRLWELFDEAVRYEEDPSGVHAGLVAIKTKKETEYRAYEACKRQIDGLTKGLLKVHRDKAVKLIQTLFLYHIAHTRQQGITADEIANAVLIERSPDSNVDENTQHYETIADCLKRELRQVVQSFDEDKRARYRFDPVFTGVDPRDEFRKARDEAEANELMQREAWDHLLALDEWPVKTRQMTIDLSAGVRSIFRDIAPFVAPWEGGGRGKTGDQEMETGWQGRQTFGVAGMRDLARLASEGVPLQPLDTAQSDLDFALYVSTRPAPASAIQKLLAQRKDPRIMLWTPADLSTEERDRLVDFAAYRKLVADWQGKDTEDAVAVINWVANSLQSDMGRIAKVVDNSYGRGRVDAMDHSQMTLRVAGELGTIAGPLAGLVLSAAYESRDIRFDPPLYFRREEAVKVINGIVTTGEIPKGAKPNQNISAVQNFGLGLKIIKKSAERALDVSGNVHVGAIWDFIDTHLPDDGTMKVETLYKNFMGIGGPKDFGLTRRMVQLYLLCLVRNGKVRVVVAPKAGLPANFLDYANMAGLEVSAKVLDAFHEVQKIAKPENWDILRPYGEKLLAEVIPATLTEAEISAYRVRLRELFSGEQPEAERTVERSRALFDALGIVNPYATEVGQIGALFGADLEGGDDISRLLHAMKEALGYQAFDTNAVSQTEVDDLANRLRNYRDVQQLLGFETEIRTAKAYCDQALPDLPELKSAAAHQRGLKAKLADLQPYIDSDVRLRSELIGKVAADGGDGTLGALIHEYTTAYAVVHNATVDAVEQARREIVAAAEGDDLKALEILEGITALQPEVSGKVVAELQGMGGSLFRCPSPSQASVEEQLRSAPTHECGLTFDHAAALRNEATGASAEARARLDQAVDTKLGILLTPAIRQRLEQGKAEAVIAQVLTCDSAKALRGVLVPACLAGPGLVEVINRYLKRIVVKRVRIADFKPSVATVEGGHIPAVSREFEGFLKRQLSEVSGDKDNLPILLLE